MLPFAAGTAGRLIEPGEFRSSTQLLLAFAAIGLAAAGLYYSGMIGAVLRLAGVLIRGAVWAGFRAWERLLSWALWPLFLGAQVALLGGGVATAGALPALAVACALAPLGMGLAAVLAYMFVDLERYEVARGYKALHTPP